MWVLALKVQDCSSRSLFNGMTIWWSTPDLKETILNFLNNDRKRINCISQFFANVWILIAPSLVSPFRLTYEKCELISLHCFPDQQKNSKFVFACMILSCRPENKILPLLLATLIQWQLRMDMTLLDKSHYERVFQSFYKCLASAKLLLLWTYYQAFQRLTWYQTLASLYFWEGTR